MPKPYSEEFGTRVIEDVLTGALRREAAEHYGISPSVVVIWAQRFEATGSVAAKSSGGSASPLEEPAKFLMSLIALALVCAIGRQETRDSGLNDRRAGQFLPVGEIGDLPQ